MAKSKSKANNNKKKQEQLERKQYYKGRDRIKAAGVPVEWTQERIDEWLKCKNDPVYFAKNYIHIVNVDAGLQLCNLYEHQEEMVRSAFENRFTAVVTARQAGKTTAAVCIIIHAILFNEYEYVALTANNERTARKILQRIQIAYKELPFWLQQGVIEWNKGSVKFENGSEITAAATSSDSIRGDSVTFLYIDEVAFVDNWEQFSSSVIPTISSGKTTRIFYTSTPNGLNHFYQIVRNGKEGKNSFNIIEAPWWRVPERDENWKQEALELVQHDWDKFRQEYECTFQGSAGTLINTSTLKNLVNETPIEQDNGIFKYEEPIEGHVYVICADVSRGKGIDYSACSVIDVTTMPYRQVCVYRNNMITPSDYSAVLFGLGKMYNEAFILVEVNDIGAQVSENLYHEYEYECILFTESAGSQGKRIAGGFGSKNIDAGVRTTKTVKSIGCSMLKMLVERQQLIIKDFNTIHELSVFSANNTTYEAQPGHTDDIVMGLVLFAWLTNDSFFKEITNIDTMSALRQVGQQFEDDLLPFGIVYNGIGDRGEGIPDTEQENDGTVWNKADIFP